LKQFLCFGIFDYRSFVADSREWGNDIAERNQNIKNFWEAHILLHQVKLLN